VPGLLIGPDRVADWHKSCSLERPRAGRAGPGAVAEVCEESSSDRERRTVAAAVGLRDIAQPLSATGLGAAAVKPIRC